MVGAVAWLRGLAIAARGVGWRRALRLWLLTHRRRILALAVGLTAFLLLRWLLVRPDFVASWSATWAKWWWLAWLIRLLAGLTACGFTVTLASEYDDWRVRSRATGRRSSRWWRLLAPVDILAWLVQTVWDGFARVFVGYWLGLVPQFVEALGYAVYESLVAILTGGLSRIYGTYIICGLPGYGKGLIAAHLLANLRRVYGDKIGIGTNLASGWRGVPEHGIKGEDVRITGWRQLCQLPLEDKQQRTWVFFVDETQNSFGNREFKSFPKELEFLTTQSRKYGGSGQGVMLLLTAQDFLDLDPKIRRLAQKVIDARNLFRGRWVHATGYDGESGYRDGEDPLIGKARKVTYRRSFIARSWLRRSYNTHDLALILGEYETEDVTDPVEQLRIALEKSAREQRRGNEMIAAALGKANGRVRVRS